MTAYFLTSSSIAVLREAVQSAGGGLRALRVGGCTARTRCVQTSASPQSSRRALPPAKDVGILTMTLSVIANSRFRTILPTNHPCGCAGAPKNILSFKGLQSTLAQMIRRRTIFGNNILSPRNGSKIKPANADACRQ